MHAGVPWQKMLTTQTPYPAPYARRRCRATECLGLLIEHLGPRQGPVASLVPQALQAAVQGFALEHSELKEYSHGLFACAAKVCMH